jgi:hypothetical protein
MPFTDAELRARKWVPVPGTGRWARPAAEVEVPREQVERLEYARDASNAAANAALAAARASGRT